MLANFFHNSNKRNFIKWKIIFINLSCFITKDILFFCIYAKNDSNIYLICFIIQTKKILLQIKSEWSSICFIIKIKNSIIQMKNDPILSNLFYNPSERNTLIIKKKNNPTFCNLFYNIQMKKFCYGPKMKPACTQFHRSILLKVNNINTFLCIITTGSVLFLVASLAWLISI